MKFLSVPVVMIAMLLAGVAQAGAEDVIRAKLKVAMPKAEIVSIRATPAGLYEVNAKGYEPVYATADGRYLFQGRAGSYSPRSVLRIGGFDSSIASRVWHAETPDPQ